MCTSDEAALLLEDLCIQLESVCLNSHHTAGDWNPEIADTTTAILRAVQLPRVAFVQPETVGVYAALATITMRYCYRHTGAPGSRAALARLLGQVTMDTDATTHALADFDRNAHRHAIAILERCRDTIQLARAYAL